MTIAEGLQAVRASIEAACHLCGRDLVDVDLVAVSKTRPADAIREALAEGQEVFGENKVQELLVKSAELKDENVRWHMIGSLQTNKVKDLLRAPGLELVHSLDRQKLADTMERVFAGADRTMDVLMQVNATGEEQKHGVAPDEAEGLLRHLLAECPHLRVRGVMAMGPLEGDPGPVFEEVEELRRQLEDATGYELPVLSLGMTDDLVAAIAAGSNLVRVGTAIFGERA